MVAKSDPYIGARVQSPDGGADWVIAAGGSLVIEAGGKLISDGVEVTANLGGGGALISASGVPVSSAQILNSAVTPIEIIPAPGPGKFISLIDTAWQYIHVTTDYNADTVGACDLYYAGNATSNQGITDTDVPTLLHGGGGADHLNQGTAAVGTVSPLINDAVVFFSPDIPPEDGDGHLVVFVSYLIRTAS